VAADVAAQAAPPARISIGDVRMAEGNAGQTAFRFTVSLDRAQSARVTVDFATADGTATAPSDYTATTGTLTFAPGETAETVTVQVNGYITVEPNESFNVNLSNATGNAAIADGQAVGTILNDDRQGVSNRFTLGKVRLNRKRGTARLAVTVPGPGKLAISGNRREGSQGAVRKRRGHGAAADQGEREKAQEAEPDRQGDRQAEGDLHTDRRHAEHTFKARPAQEALALAVMQSLVSAAGRAPRATGCCSRRHR
jgi:hypothetical protein